MREGKQKLIRITHYEDINTHLSVITPYESLDVYCHLDSLYIYNLKKGYPLPALMYTQTSLMKNCLF